MLYTHLTRIPCVTICKMKTEPCLWLLGGFYCISHSSRVVEETFWSAVYKDQGYRCVFMLSDVIELQVFKGQVELLDKCHTTL